MKSLLLGLLMCLSTAAIATEGWKYDFETQLKQTEGPAQEKSFHVNKIDITQNGHALRFDIKGGNASFGLPIKYEISAGREIKYLQYRVKETTPGVWMLLGSNLGGTPLTYTEMRPGLITLQYFGPWLKNLKNEKGTASLNAYLGGGGKGSKTPFLEIGEPLHFIDKNGIDGIFFRATHADGTAIAPGSAISSGDMLTVRMPVSEKPDALHLSFFIVNTGKDWGKKSRWEALDLPGAPTLLKANPANPLEYLATFKVPKLGNELKLQLNTLIAAIHYAGGDSHDNGMYYGFMPFAANFEKGSATEEDSTFMLYDFGPADSVVQNGAILISSKDNKKMPSSLKWAEGLPYNFAKGRFREWDSLWMDFCEVSNSLTMEVNVPAGQRYKVVTGFGVAGAYCWVGNQYFPMSAQIKVNGVQIYETLGSDKQIYEELYKGADASEDYYKRYVMPFVHDAVTEVDAPDGKIRITIVNLNGKAKKVPLNYLLVYPAGDQECETRFQRLLSNRELKYRQYWQDVTPSEEQLRTNLTADASVVPANGMRLFARENPMDCVFGNSYPLLSEVGAELRIVASPDELISGACMLRSGKPIKAVELKAVGFPAEVHPELLMVMEHRFTAHFTGKHWLAPNQLLPSRARDIDANHSYSYLLRFKAEPSTAGKRFTGKLIAKGADGSQASLPVTLEILPCTLPKLEDHLICMLGGHSDSEIQLRFCKEELNCTTATRMYSWPYTSTEFKYDNEGNIIDFIKVGGATHEMIDTWFKNYVKAGFACKTPFVSLQCMGYREPMAFGSGSKYKAFSKEYCQAIQVVYNGILKHAKDNGLESIVIDCGGEMGYELKIPARKTMDDAIELYRLIKKSVPGAKVSYRCNCYATVENFYPELDVMGVRGAKSWISADRLTELGKNKHIYTYSVEGRYMNGIHSWAHGAKGNLREWVTFPHCVICNDFLCEGSCGGTYHYEAMQGPDGTLIPTLRSEAWRASVIDRRYLRYLEDAIKACPKKELRANAENFLSLLREATMDFVPMTGVPYQYQNNPWCGLRMDIVREICAQLVVDMQAGRRSTLPAFKCRGARGMQELETNMDFPNMPVPERAKKAYDFSHWIPIRVGESWEQQGIPYDGYGWYRCNFTIPAGWTEPLLHFGAADETAWIWVNGIYQGTHDGWNESFTIPLKGFEAGKQNTLAVVVLDRNAMGGLWKDIYLCKNEAACKEAGNASNRIKLDNGWRLILEPGKRDLTRFVMSDGPFVYTQTKGINCELFLAPASDTAAKGIASSGVVMKVTDAKGALKQEKNLGRMVPYKTQHITLDSSSLGSGAYTAALYANGEKLAEYNFFKIPPVTAKLK